jgi:N-methylhydantoinase B
MNAIDPITFEIVRHRLFRIVEEAVITLKNVSGSATTNEGHDLMVSLYTADGGLLMGGVGFLHHLSSASIACKQIIRRFAGRIEEQDIYLLNDPYTAALHTSDVYLIAPIHFSGRLVAWSACFVHINDVGARNPGGFSPDAPDIFSEGFSSPGLRIVHAGEICDDVLDTILNMVRTPEMVALDIRSMIACNSVARDRLVNLLERYGEDVVSAVGAALIEQSESLFRTRLKELPDGRWSARQFMDVEGRVSEIHLTMQKTDDRLVFDFTGSSPQADRGINCTRHATWGGLLAPLYPLLCHDIVWNEGIFRAVEMIAPEGTIVNCRRPAPVSIATTAAVQAVNNVSLICISKMQSEHPRYKDEATAVWHGGHLSLYLYLRNKAGNVVIGSTTETFGGAGGAGFLSDGQDIGGEIPNPISRMANVETNEATYPIRYLFRRRMRDSGGPGWHRGGTGGEYVIVPHDAGDNEFGFVLSGKGVQFPMGHGLAGGYPGSPNRFVIVRAAGLAAQPDGKTPIPSTLEACGEQIEEVSWGQFRLSGDDALYVRWNGGGGYGDPLERDPEAVARDVRDGTVTNDSAENVHGVVLRADGSADGTATAARREETRKNRVAESKALPKARLDDIDNTYPSRLNTVSRLRERPMSDVQEAYTTVPEALVREYMDSSGRMLEVQVGNATLRHER